MRKPAPTFFSIESTGGKEVHDEALVNGDMPAAAFALGVLACRDMAWLWDMIVDVGNRYGVIPAGDSACGFGNTAMVLAEKRYIPRVWAAAGARDDRRRAAWSPTSAGAVGPGKDCAYENPYLKAITGCPMSGEGAEAACAHLSPVGNIARVTADLWSNESVQNVKLLGGMTPTVSVEQLDLRDAPDEPCHRARPRSPRARCATGTRIPTCPTTRRRISCDRTWC